MNKQLIVYMSIIILYMQKKEELKKVMKEVMVFFVLRVQRIEFVFKKLLKIMKNSCLRVCKFVFQFFVSCYGFSVLVLYSGNFNSLYFVPDSLKMKNNGNTQF
jgi:hypothetical protein